MRALLNRHSGAGRVTFGFGLIAALLALAVALAILTLPPKLPSHAATVAAWQPSEAWLYDRKGQLLDSQRVNFAARRLGWVPLNQISPVLIETVIAAEDKRFRDHRGIDWLAIASAVRARVSGEPSARGKHDFDAVGRLSCSRSCATGRAQLARQAPPDAQRISA